MEMRWEQIELDQVEEGDIIKVITSSSTDDYLTFSEAVARIGVHKPLVGGWNAGNLRIIHDGDLDKNFTRSIFRQVPVYELPKGFGAIVSARHKTSGTIYELVNTGQLWVFKHQENSISTEGLGKYYKDFTTIAEGI